MMDGMAASTTLPQQKSEATAYAPGRVVSVDLLRGLTVALMILVNDPGDWSHLFRQLDHAEWSGWTLTDLVFPTFLFLMGVAMVLSMDARAARGDGRWTRAGKIVSRAAKIFALDLILTFFPGMHWTRLRFYGVLTRIALCYLIAGLIMLATKRVRILAAIVAVLLIGYWVLLRWVPVPGAGMPVRDIPLLDPVRNWTSWIDRGVVAFTQHWLHTGRLYKQVRDPEGLLSTLPAVATTLLGVLAGFWMQKIAQQGVGEGARVRMRRTQMMLAGAGVAGIAVGTIWGIWFPINKNLWTSSYVVLTAGVAALALAACSWLMDGHERPWPRWLEISTWPWLVYGSNAIAAFVISEALVKTMIFIKLTDADGERHSLWELSYQKGFEHWGSNEWTSLAFAVTFVAVCFVPIWLLWRKKIFLKV
jgi:predicted acyltransferase